MNNFDYTPQNDQQPPINFDMAPQQPSKNGKGFAIAALVLGIVSLVFICCCCVLYRVAIVPAILAIVMAVLAKRDNGGKMQGMATAGLILAIIAIVLFVCLIAVDVLFAMGTFNEALDEFFYENFGMSMEEYMELYSNGEVPFPTE